MINIFVVVVVVVFVRVRVCALVRAFVRAFVHSCVRVCLYGYVCMVLMYERSSVCRNTCYKTNVINHSLSIHRPDKFLTEAYHLNCGLPAALVESLVTKY